MLGKHSENYSLSNDGEIYITLPYELNLFIVQNSKENKTETLNKVYNIYLDNIHDAEIDHPESLQKAYKKAHKEIRKKKLLKKLETTNLNMKTF